MPIFNRVDGMLNWEAIGAIGEILGAIGVIVTLGYLASQIRQNTKASRSESVQSLAESGATMNAMIIEEPDVAREFLAGMSDYRSLPAEDRLRFRFLIGQWLLAFEAVYIQHNMGTVDKHVFDSRMRLLEEWLNNDGGLAAWKAARSGFSVEYVEYIEKNVIHN